MNQQQIEGKWLQFKGALREKWGELTDSQLEETAGRHEQVVGLLEEHYGYSKEKAEVALKKMGERLEVSPSYAGFWDTIEQGWQELQQTLATTKSKCLIAFFLIHTVIKYLRIIEQYHQRFN